MQDSSFEVINHTSDHPLIITCEHANSKIPNQYNNLGLTEDVLNTHIARDKGAKELTQKLAQELGCFAIMGNYSRLLIDLNRRPDEKELIVSTSDKITVPNNLSISKEEKNKRLKDYYYPYYQQIEKQINFLQKQKIKPVILSIHSFTPQLKTGKYRPWHTGILWHKPTKLASYLYDKLQNKGKKIGENVPYDLRKYNTGTAVVCGEEQGFDYALIEIRDDEFADVEQGSIYWSNLLANCLKEYFNKQYL